MKPEDEFGPRRPTSGFRGQCAPCLAEIKAANRVDPGVSRMLSSARSRASAKGLPFTITAGDISIPDRCPILGVPLATGARDNAASLDRIVPALGYTPENTVVISARANRIKNDATPDELRAVADFVIALRAGLKPPKRRRRHA